MKKFLSILLCVCLMFTTVVAVPSVSAEEQVKEYDYLTCDYENLAEVDTETWFGKGDAVTASLETEAPINGSASLRISKNATGYGGFSVFPDDVALKAGAYYRVTATAQVQSGSFNLGKLGNMGGKADGSYNWAHINIYANYTGNPDNGGTPLILWTQWVEKGASAAFTKQGTIKVSENTQYSHLGIAVSAKTLDATTNEASMLIDNVVAAEIIDTVSVANSDETKGTVAVANKNADYTDYAMGETAVFTATPTEGYQLAGWYNGDVLVSKEATYEHTLTGDTTLTAKWKLYEKEYDYIECDYENLTDYETWFSKADGNTGVLTVSLETENPISGSSSLKLTKTTVGGNAGYGGFAVFPDAITLKSGKYYRIKANTKIQSGSFTMARFGNIGSKNATSYNWAHIFNVAEHTGQTDNGGTPLDIWRIWAEQKAGASFATNGTLKISENASLARLGIALNAKTLDATTNEASILLDNVVAAEIIDTVAVVNSDEAKGTVSVANKESKYTDYAKGEVAVFTATPAEGYSFAGWYNSEDVLVSDEATYEHTLTTDTTLTAKWKLYEKEYDYKAYDYENMTDTDAWFATAKDGVMSFETANPISGNSSLKITASKTGYMGGAVIPNNVALKSATTYRLTASTKVSTGVFNYGRVGSAGLSSGVVNIWNIGTGTEFTNGSSPVHLLDSNWVKFDNTKPVKAVTDKLTTATNGLLVFGGIFSVSAVDENSTASILIDDLVAAEIIGSVSATSSDSAMGSATVVNKAGFEDYAKNEVAVFTATPANGYYLEGWYNANGEKVSTDKVYEVTLTTDTNLTAKFAAYDKLYTISFNTNGGNEIQSITNGAGADIVLPETPVKAGFTFAGWYADVDCTNPFTATTMPEENTTVFAKWIVGSYVDFENFEGTPTGNFTVMNDAENAYLGNGYLKYSAAAKDNGSRITLTDGKAIKDFALPGDKIEISFKYKFLSGDARFYMHTSAQPDKVALTNRKQEGETKDLWINNYVYKNTIFATVSEEWQTLTVVYDLKNLNQAATERFTAEDYLYSVLFLISDNGAELYIDDVTLSLVPGEHVKTAYNNAAALRSAEASSTGKNGLRIYNEIDTHWAEDKNIVEYGSVAAFASNINGEITVENGNKGIAYSDGTLSAEKLSAWEVTEHTVVFTSYLTNIGTLRYGEDILIRSYAIAADGTVYYGKTATVSVFDVANAIDNAQTADGSEVSAEDSNAFYAFVNSANNAAYQAWCTENGKTLGALYSAKY